MPSTDTCLAPSSTRELISSTSPLGIITSCAKDSSNMPSDDIANSAANPTIQVLGGGRISYLYIFESKHMHKILCFGVFVI